MAYIAVPTPSEEITGSCDTSIVEDVLSQLPDGFNAVIKSTVPPGTTNEFQIKFPSLKIAYCPEFLVERRSLEDFGRQDILVVGSDHQELAELVYQQHLEAGVIESGAFFFTTSTQAELVKYSKNMFYAMKVIFANQMFDICEVMGEDWGVVSDIITAPQRQLIGDSHLDPIFGERRGFGGSCLPKDTLALKALADSLGVKYDLLEAIQSDNSRLREIVNS
jgi:UDPglucose 6-dehydrogenase